MRNNQVNNPQILLTGATGYIGGRLLRVLQDQGLPVRCLARKPEFIKSRLKESSEVVAGDLLDITSLNKALEGIHTAYYLVHSMDSSKKYGDMDRRAAQNFMDAGLKQGVRRIIYLGGLGDPDDNLSDHLRSRQEVGQILRSSPDIITIELRASIIIGSGSLSFELIRALTEKLPVMIMPRWVNTLAQPIAIDDVLAYLFRSIDLNVESSTVIEIGGSDQLSYHDLMREYSRQRQLRRLMIPVPVLTPYLSSLWLGLVTPVFARIGRQLVGSLKNPTIVTEVSAHVFFSVSNP